MQYDFFTNFIFMFLKVHFSHNLTEIIIVCSSILNRSHTTQLNQCTVKSVVPTNFVCENTLIFSLVHFFTFLLNSKKSKRNTRTLIFPYNFFFSLALKTEVKNITFLCLIQKIPRARVVIHVID